MEVLSNRLLVLFEHVLFRSSARALHGLVDIAKAVKRLLEVGISTVKMIGKRRKVEKKKKNRKEGKDGGQRREGGSGGEREFKDGKGNIYISKKTGSITYTELAILAFKTLRPLTVGT